MKQFIEKYYKDVRIENDAQFSQILDHYERVKAKQNAKREALRKDMFENEAVYITIAGVKYYREEWINKILAI